jgi:flagellar motor switch/type III secretory pathway protein FliN
MIGAPVGVRMRRTRAFSKARPFGEACSIAISSREEGNVEAVVQAERALAACVVSRALARSPALVLRAVPPSEAIAGAFAAVLAAAARRAHSDAVVPIVAAGTAEEILLQCGAMEALVALDLTVTIADDAYAARVVFSAIRASGAPELPWTRGALAGLGAMPLSLPIVATVLEMKAADLATLRSGDALVPAEWPLRRASEGGHWVGPVLLASPFSSAAIEADISAEGRVVLRGGLRAIGAKEGTIMNSDESVALVSTVGDVPVVLRVEIGEACMSAREWASLAPGDVVTTGRRVGERVVLRVGGIPLATGELVDVDGEVGVRLLERLGQEPGTEGR